MQNLLENLKRILEQDDRFVVDGKLLKNKVVEAGLQLDPGLVKLLLKDEFLKNHFFQDIEGVLVFDKVKFQQFVSNKEFLPDSYTAFKNKIGLTTNGEFLTQDKEVVLSWAYKDCVLEGGQDKEDAKRNEVFWNEVLAPGDIDRLLHPKVFTNWKKYTPEGEQEVKEVSLDDNLILKGNNLLALHSLKKVYRGKVKLIYIDPPYNTDKDSFGYNDAFKHSTWLTFMKNRMEVAKELLSKDGVLFISIDDKEHAYLKVLCDEIFERKNFMGDIVWQTATDNNPSQISTEHEYILVYAKNKEAQSIWTGKNEEAEILQANYLKIKKKYGEDFEKIQAELRIWIKQNKDKVSGVSHYDNVDAKGVFHDADVANTKFGGYIYDIIHPKTGKPCKVPEKGYRFKYETMQDMLANDDVMFGEDETTLVKPKKRLENAKDYLRSVIYEDGRASTKELEKMFHKDFFKNPKSPTVLKRLFRFVTNKESIIMDFFAGSGTTGQAVIELNQEDEGKRKFILCEQMDYAKEKTAKRVEKIIQKYGMTDFIYAELKSANQSWIDEIVATETDEVLTTLWEKMQQHAFISYKVEPKAINETASDFQALSLEDKKRFLVEVLDKNALYVNTTDMDNQDFQVSEEDKALTKLFYSLKKANG